MVDMEKALLKKLCRDHDLYVTPAINDKLYLHYKGFRCIQNLDEYTGLKVLWLEGNGLPRIEGLGNQTQLRTLYLQENLIQHIENLEAQTELDTLNLSQNQISRIENLGHMKQLSSLSLKSNYLASAQDLEHLVQLPNLSVLDVQSNRIVDPAVLDVLAKMPNLKVLYLQGNDIVKHIKQYRKTLVYRCRKLRYLDDRPVFEDERRRVDAWGKALDASGGDYKAAQEAERVEMEAIRQEKRDRDRMNFLHFEQLMAEGKRKRAEEAEAATKAASNQQDAMPQEPEQHEVNPFSGEKIVPVQDCEFLQRQREQRWEQVVNAPDAWIKAAKGMKDNQTETSGAGETLDTSASSIPVNSSRLALLQQCANVGTDASAGMTAFVESAFRMEDHGSPAMPPPAPTLAARHPRPQDLLTSHQSNPNTDPDMERLAPATRLLTCGTFLLNNTAPPSAHVVMPPPAPVTATAKPPTTKTKTTNVDELD